MGSRCGTIRYVPFEETWPPTENNLAGPYWERRREGKGIHAPDYTPSVVAGASAAAGGLRTPKRYSRGRQGSRFAGRFFGPSTKLFFAFALTFAAITGCALGLAGCCSGEEAGAGGGVRGGRRRSSGGSGGAGARKPRGRPQWARRSGMLGARNEDWSVSSGGGGVCYLNGRARARGRVSSLAAHRAVLVVVGSLTFLSYVDDHPWKLKAGKECALVLPVFPD